MLTSAYPAEVQVGITWAVYRRVTDCCAQLECPRVRLQAPTAVPINLLVVPDPVPIEVPATVDHDIAWDASDGGEAVTSLI